jgi:hypothetical protein
MKRLLILLLLVSPVFFAACPGVGEDGNGGDDTGGSNNETGSDGARVVFDNSGGLCPVMVYETNDRTDAVKIVEVSAGAVSAVIPWRTNPGYTFYLAYSVFIEDVPVVYIPKPGSDQLLCRIDANIITTVNLPPLGAALDSEETPLSGAAHVVLKNDSYSSCYLIRGSRIITPDNMDIVSGSHIVNSSEKALYILSDPGAAEEYKLFVNGRNIAFSGVDGDFEGGRIYTFGFSNANVGEFDLSLESNTAIVLANVSMAQGMNKQYSFTTWRDKKIAAANGETVTGNNAIIFYGDSAKLIGPYWQHPAGDFNYSGQILESYFSDQNDGMVIWTLKSERTGYLLRMQEDQTLQAALAGAAPHPFYKQ